MATAPDILTAPTQGKAGLRLADGVHFLPNDQIHDPAFQSAWVALAENASEPNPFFESWFLTPALTHIAQREQIELCVFIVGGQFAGLFPLARSNSYYGYPLPHCATWLHDNAFCGIPLVREGAERSFWSALFAAIDDNPRKALFLHLPYLCETGPVAEALEAVANAQARGHGVVQREQRAMLMSELNAADYLANSMSQKRRKELRRLHKRLSECGDLQFERLEGAENLDQWIEEFLTLERNSWKGDEGSALGCAAATTALFKQALSGAAAMGRLERLAFRLNGEPIAMLANFICPPGGFSFKTSFDDRFAKHSPGLLLQLENLALLERDDIQWADSCAAEGHSMIERLWREKRAMQSLNIAIGGPLRRAMFDQLIRREARERKTQ
jgi:CelD/BcsL family acetyltransferase involved in cellulose biosynthesis